VARRVNVEGEVGVYLAGAVLLPAAGYRPHVGAGADRDAGPVGGQINQGDYGLVEPAEGLKQQLGLDSPPQESDMHGQPD